MNKADFPIFQKYPNLTYLDSAATTQKPSSVIKGITQYYTDENANIHRGIYDLSAQATQKYEAVRGKVKDYFSIPHLEEIIFTKGTTEGINLVAQSFVLPHLKAGDNIVISAMEHHANLVVWQHICQQRKANLRVIPINQNGTLEMTVLDKLLDERSKLVALVHISNTLGTINPIKEVIEKAHQKNIPVLIDGAQSILYPDLNIANFEADFWVCSGHKMFGPTGVGILYGKRQYLEEMQPYQFGGDMIRSVTFEATSFAKLPHKFEAGTPNIAGVIGLGYALDYLKDIDKYAVNEHLKKLTNEATARLLEIEGLRIIGRAKNKSGILSLVLEEVHPHDAATFLNEQNIAVRAGHHCTQPLMDFYQISGTLRASFSGYNTMEDVEKLVDGMKGMKRFFV